MRSGGSFQGPRARFGDHRVLEIHRAGALHTDAERHCGSSVSVPSARRAGSRERSHVPARSPVTSATICKGRRVPALAGPHVRGSKISEGVSTFRIVLQKSFDGTNAQRRCLRVFTRAVNGS